MEQHGHFTALPAADEVFRLAQAAFRSEDFDRAISLCRRILEAAPDTAAAFDLLASALHRSGGLGEEIAALKSAIESGEGTPGHYLSLGELQRVAGDTGDAIATLEQAAATEPDNPLIRLRLGMARYDNGRLAAAATEFNRALELDPRSAPAHYFLGNIHRESRNWQEAWRAYSTALGLDADYPPACLALAKLLFRRKKSEDRKADLERAADLAQRAIGLGAGTFDDFLFAGKILLELERFEEAKSALQAAAGFGERHPDLYVALSVAHAGLDEIGMAQNVSLRLMREFPSGSRLSANPEAEVLVLETLYETAFRSPMYGSNIHAHSDIIAALPPDRVSLHHIFIAGIKTAEIESYRNKYNVIYNNLANAETNFLRGNAKAVQYIMDHTGLPVVNPPDLTNLTTRRKNYERLHDIDHLIFPKTVAVNPGDDGMAGIMERVAAAFEFPVLLRRAHTHRASTVEKVENIDALREALTRFGDNACYVIQFHDSKHSSGNSLRYRGSFIGGKFYPGRMYLSENWLVGPSSGRAHEKKLMEINSDFQNEEMRWLADPPSVIGEANMAALCAVDDVLKLDCYGVDFGLVKDGRVIVFEANPCMNLLTIRRHVARFPYLRQAAEDIKTALEDLLIGMAHGRDGRSANRG